MRRILLCVALCTACTSTPPIQNPMPEPKPRKGELLQAPTSPRVPPKEVHGGTLNLTMNTALPSLNWLIENSVQVANFQSLIHASLAERDYENPDHWVPGLAHSVTRSEDGKVYTVRLREVVMWQDPLLANASMYTWARGRTKSLRARDFKLYFDMVRDERVPASALRSYYRGLDRVVILDDLTFEVHWRENSHSHMTPTLSAYPLPYWLYSRTNSGEPLLASEIGAYFTRHHAGRWGVGVGPYQVSRNVASSEVSLIRHKGFRGDVPAFEQINYRVASTPQSRLQLFKQGRSDLRVITASEYQRLKTSSSEAAQTFDFLGYSYIGWNADKPLFADRRVRRAMTHAFSRTQFIQAVYHGLGRVQFGPYFHQHPANNPDIRPLAFDLAKARALLDEVGWKDSDGDGIRDKVVNGKSTAFSFTLLCYRGSAEWKTVMSVFQEDLSEIGVQMKLSLVDWPTMQKKMNEKKFDAFTGGWGLGWDIDPYQIWHSSQADEPKGSNRVAFRNPRADTIIETLRVSFDTDERIKLLREFHKIVHDEQPYTFFRSPKVAFLTSSRLAAPPVSKLRPHLNPLRWHFKKP